jgi:DNA-binding helix-hairpin-helix protein with protein kinase domain
VKNVASAFSSIHALGVRHGDVRKENILVRADESVVVVDFERSVFDVSAEDLEEENDDVHELLMELHGRRATCIVSC